MALLCWQQLYVWGILFGNLSNHDDERQRKPHKFAYLTMKNSIFVRFARAFFSSFDILKAFSFFLRREMTCFAVVWTTWAYDDTCSILSCYLKSAGSNLIPGKLEHNLQAQWLWITATLLKKREVTFSDEVLAVVDVAFA